MKKLKKRLSDLLERIGNAKPKPERVREIGE